MIAALCHIALLLAAPRRTHKAHPVDPDRTHEFWYWIEDHGDIVVPILGVAIVALVFFGIRRGMTSSTVELQQRQDRKDRIVRMMRAKLLVTADAVAGELQIDRFAASGLLEDLVKEGKLVEQRGTGGIATYRLKGL